MISPQILWIDSRESPMTKQFVQRLIGEKYTQVIKLDCADFYTEDNCDPPHSCGIERKTHTDFMQSLSSGRMESQLARICEAYTHPILLIEGGAFAMSKRGQMVRKRGREDVTYVASAGGKVMRGDTELGWSHAAVQMLILSIQRRYPSLRITFTRGRDESGDLIRVLHKRAREGCFNGDDPDVI